MTMVLHFLLVIFNVALLARIREIFHGLSLREIRREDTVLVPIGFDCAYRGM